LQPLALRKPRPLLDRVYVIDQRGEVVLSGTGLCWRTGFWTPAAAAKDPAGCKCDKDLLPKEVCEPPVIAKGACCRTGRQAFGDKITVAADALFDFDKATLRPEGKQKLDEVVAKSKQIKLEVIIAVGHTDRLVPTPTTRSCPSGVLRGQGYLVSKGVEANRVYTEGKGKKNPVTKPDQCPGAKSKKVIECLQPDRRVDIELIGTK
jgi:OOP family OmpA-OmpF porin